MIRHFAAAAALAVLLTPALAAAQEPQSPPAAASPADRTALEMRADEVVGAINGTADPARIFTPGFLKAVPPAQLAAVSASFTAQLGKALAVASLTPREGTRAALVVRFERGTATGGIAIDPAQGNLVNELLFTQLDSRAPDGDTPAKIAADLAALPGSVNAWLAPLDGGAPVIAIGADKPLALGSTFKLYVLAALAEDVKAGKRQWSDVVPLTEKSYPSGQLQNWPKGAPLTLYSLASLMISLSDNTATDQLIRLLGKARILKAMKDSGHSNPTANDPFLTTRELFVLKTLTADEIAGRNARALMQDPAIQSFAALAHPPLDKVNAAFLAGPKALQLEWFASPADLVKLFAHMRRTADPAVFDMLAINPSATPAIKANWAYIGFKGGSEPGVINLTWLLNDKAGTWYVLTMGWNNPEAVIDEGKFEGLAQRILLLPR